MNFETFRDRSILLTLRGIRLTSQLKKNLYRHIFDANKGKQRADPLHNQLVRTAAKSLKLEVEDLPYDFLRISNGDTVVYANDFNFSLESLTAYWMCGDKHLTSLLLNRGGIPVPEFRTYNSSNLGSAFSDFPSRRCPVVVKPCFGSCGQGVTVGVRTISEFRKACFRAALTSERIMVEEFVSGRHWRLTLFNGELINALERLPAFVTGDGASSIDTLVRHRNNRIGVRNGFAGAYPIRIDTDTRWMLEKQGMTLSSVPSAGRKVILKSVCNAAVGGMTVDVTARLHNDYFILARKAAAIMGARVAGVDIIAPDVTMPMSDGSVFVNEVNTTPDLMLSRGIL